MFINLTNLFDLYIFNKFGRCFNRYVNFRDIIWSRTESKIIINPRSQHNPIILSQLENYWENIGFEPIPICLIIVRTYDQKIVLCLLGTHRDIIILNKMTLT